MLPLGVVHLLQQLLLWATVVCLSWSAVHATAASVNVSTSAELLAALQSSADTIVLQKDVAMGAEFDQFVQPLQINRWADHCCATWLSAKNFAKHVLCQ